MSLQRRSPIGTLTHMGPHLAWQDVKFSHEVEHKDAPIKWQTMKSTSNHHLNKIQRRYGISSSYTSTSMDSLKYTPWLKKLITQLHSWWKIMKFDSKLDPLLTRSKSGPSGISKIPSIWLNGIRLLKWKIWLHHYAPCEKLSKISVKLVWLWNCQNLALKESFRFLMIPQRFLSASWLKIYCSDMKTDQFVKLLEKFYSFEYKLVMNMTLWNFGPKGIF